MSSAKPLRKPTRPPTLGAEYLQQAVDAIRACGSSDALYEYSYRRTPVADRNEIMQALMARRAADHRVRSSRSAILFTAFAAEAYINEFIAAHFAGRDRDTIDRLPPAEKYTLAPRLAFGHSLFPRGKEPAQTISSLFRQRDVLVHPKPGRGLPESDRWQADPVFNPLRAMAYVLPVATAAKVLVAHAKAGDRFDLYVELILRGAAFLTDYAAAASRDLVGPDQPPAPDLLIEVLRQWQSAR